MWCRHCVIREVDSDRAAAYDANAVVVQIIKSEGTGVRRIKLRSTWPRPTTRRGCNPFPPGASHRVTSEPPKQKRKPYHSIEPSEMKTSLACSLQVMYYCATIDAT